MHIFLLLFFAFGVVVCQTDIDDEGTVPTTDDVPLIIGQDPTTTVKDDNLNEELPDGNEPTLPDLNSVQDYVNDLKIEPKVHSHIGNLTRIKKFPFVASFQRNGKHYCSGSLIGPGKVLTAAHCTYDELISKLTVRVGSSVANSRGQVSKVLSISQHPLYNIFSNEHDISIVFTKRLFRTSYSVRPIALAKSPIPTDSVLQVAGWGYQCSNCVTSKYLRNVQVSSMSRKLCNDFFDEEIGIGMLCAGFPEVGSASCYGDVGGPLISVHKKLVGVMSDGYGCGNPDEPGVYTNVIQYLQWIEVQKPKKN